MNTKAAPKPTWITLYSLGAIGMAALFFVPSLHVAPLMHTMIMLLIMAALYGAIGMWISANSYALEMEEYEQTKAQYQIHYDVARQPASIETDVPVTETQPIDSHDHQEAA